jgi:putative transposase
MPEYRRADIPGGTYFFTVVTFARQPHLTLEPVRKALREAIADVRQSHPFRIDAWVLLPDHLHCMWTLPPGDKDFTRRWSTIKRLVSRQCSEYAAPIVIPSRKRRREFTFWQRRFWEHLIRDDADFRRHADYIHWNPVKHGHAAAARDWPYSTFHRYVEQGIYAPDWGGRSAENEAGEFGE